MGIKKSSKGEIRIENFRGRIRLRWRYAGERYTLNIPYAYLPENLHHGTVTASEIKLDIMKCCFDFSLEKYKPEVIVKPTGLKPEEIASKKKTQSPVYLNELASNFNDWCNNIRNIDVENSIDYLYTRKLLEKWIKVPIDQIAQKLNAENWAVTTYNRRPGLS